MSNQINFIFTGIYAAQNVQMEVVSIDATVNSRHSSVERLLMEQQVSHQCLYRYVEEIGYATMLATKRSAGVTPEMNLRECVTCKPLPSANKAAHFGFKPQRRRHQKSKTGISVAPTKRTHVLQKKYSLFYSRTTRWRTVPMK